jgi:uncharacterized membrane protein
MLRTVSLGLLVILYVGAGVNHFLHPRFYEAIMPPVFPEPRALVYVSGVVEVILGVLLLFTVTRVWAARLIAAMLVVFIPVHVYMLQQAYDVPGYRTTVTAASLRLLLQPVLIVWVLWQGKPKGALSGAPIKRGIA